MSSAKHTPLRLFFVMGYGWFLDMHTPRLVVARVLFAKDKKEAHAICTEETKSGMAAISMVARKLTDKGGFVDKIVVTDLGPMPFGQGGVQ